MSEYSNQGSKTAGVIIILVLVLAGLAGGWYLLIYQPEQEAKEKARLEQIAKEEAEKRKKELAAQKKAKYDQLIVDADTAFAQENWKTAHSLYSEASSLLPDQQYPKDQLALLNPKLDELAALEAKRAAGTVETVASRTGRFYVIVSSSVDDDLATDYANKLAKEGNYVKIIEHNAKKLSFYGVSPADYDTREQAEAALTSFSTYGNEVWVLRY